MKAYTYIEKGRFELLDKPKPELMDPKDAIVRVTLSSICSSDLHIKHGSVPHSFQLSRIEDGYKVFENKKDGVIKVAIENRY